MHTHARTHTHTLTLAQLVSECRETLDQAIKIRTFYRDNIKLVTDSDPSKLAQVETKMEHFERDLKAVLQVSSVMQSEVGGVRGGRSEWQPERVKFHE